MLFNVSAAREWLLYISCYEGFDTKPYIYIYQYIHYIYIYIYMDMDI